MSNRFNINEAYPGFCSLCHDEVAEFDGFIHAGNGAMRPRITKLKGNFRLVNIELSDGSTMSVALCKKCENFKPEDAGKLMESEVRGWKRECDELLNLKPEVYDAYLRKQSRLEVRSRLDRKWSESDKARIAKPDRKNMRLPEHILKER